MPATASELTMFRAELDIVEAAMSDDVVNNIFDAAEADYSGYARKVIRYAAYTSASQFLLNRANRMVDYTANESSEKLSQLPANLAKQVAYYQKKVDEAVAEESSVGFASGRTKTIPPRVRDMPDTW